VSPRLGGELLEPQRVRPHRPTIRFATLDQLRCPAKPGGLDVVFGAEGVRGGAQPVAETLRRSQEGPCGSR